MLHSYDWSESSLIVELFTRDAGRVVAAAKGAKRPTSQLRAVLMPFQIGARAVCALAGANGGAEVRTLRRPSGAAATSMPGSGSGWFAGFYLNELLLRLLARDDPHPRLFDAYAATLQAWATARCAARRRCAPSSCCCCARPVCCPNSAAPR